MPYQNFYQSTKAKYQAEAEKPADFKTWPKSWTTIYFKEYPRLPKTLLPKPENINFPLGESFKKRKSEREFDGKQTSLKDLSQLLFYSAGIIEKREGDWNKTRRTYPSGGGRFPLEIYLCALQNSDELKEGIYHYNVKEHSLEKILNKENLRKEIYPKIIWQDMILKAPIVLAISTVFERTTIKYKERGIRYIFQEAGHLGQNIYLVSTALGLKCCALGGFDDDKFNELLDIDGETEGVIYVFALGC
jgi:SagB-type dehydrogenase family enzyme